MTIAGNSNRTVADAVYKRVKPEPAVMMQAFDQLPAIVRRAIANGADDYEVTEIAERIRRGMPAGQVLTAIERMDARIRAAAEKGKEQ